MKRYNITLGIIISFFIAIVATVPRIVRLNQEDFRITIESIIYSFSFALLCWTIIQFVFSLSRFRTKFQKGFLSILICVLLSVPYHSVAGIFFSSPIILQNLNGGQKIVILILRGMVIGGFEFFIVYLFSVLREAEHSKLENEKLKQENLQARMDVLKQQISPHFLFNALNTVQTITAEESVKQYTLQLSNVYRYLLQYKENNLVTVEEELRFIRSYLYIQKVRFEEGLIVNIKLDEIIMNMLLPPLALQIVIENAIKHNVVSLAKPLRINIYNEDKAFIIIENNVQKKLSVESTTKLGLSNIKDRYKLLSDKTIELINDDNFFIIKLPLLSNEYSTN